MTTNNTPRIADMPLSFDGFGLSLGGQRIATFNFEAQWPVENGKPDEWASVPRADIANVAFRLVRLWNNENDRRLRFGVAVSNAFGAITRCAGDQSRINEWRDYVEWLTRNTAPSGSGFDSGTTINWGRSTEQKLVFDTGFHHMNDTGYYDGWTNHTVTIRPDFTGFDVRVTGKNRNEIKDYIAHCFLKALDARVPTLHEWKKRTLRSA